MSPPNGATRQRRGDGIGLDSTIVHAIGIDIGGGIGVAELANDAGMVGAAHLARLHAAR